MKITHYIPVLPLALVVLAGGTSVLAQQAGEEPDSAAAPDACADMPMMKHGDMRGDSSTRDMMRMMRQCRKMMESMEMETDTMPMMDGMSSDSAAPSRGRGMMEDCPMKTDAGTPHDVDGDPVPEES